MMKLRAIALGLFSPLALGVAAEELPKLHVANLGMEAGTTVPDGWHGRFGTATVSRDTEVRRSGKASLCVDRTASTDPRNACAHQMLEVPPGLKLKLSGWVKAEGTTRVFFAAQFFDERFTTNDCFPVKVVEGTQDWEEQSAEITVPDNARHLALALYVEGQGKAWLDDVKLKAEGAKVVVAKPPPAVQPPGKTGSSPPSPTTATPGSFAAQPKAWKLFHESQVRQAKTSGAEVIFLGDSHTQGWTTTGRAAWEKHLAPLKAAAFGIGGDGTENLLWRLDHGLLDGLATPPKVVVVLIGANNLIRGVNSTEEVMDGTRAVVEKLRSKVPQARLLVLGALPMGAELSDANRQRGMEFNVLAATLKEWNQVDFLNPGTKLLRRDGRPMEGVLQEDLIHLTAKGYDLMAAGIAPAVVELLKAPAAEPAPPAEPGPVGK